MGQDVPSRPWVLGTWLLDDQDNPLRFVAVDRRQTTQHHEAFLIEFRLDYNAMDQACESLTERETSLGNFLQFDGDRQAH